MLIGSLCTGYGGLEMALRAAGVAVELAWYAETAPALVPILTELHPGVPNLGDVTRVDYQAVIPVDMICTGFPCQPVSAAGRQRGDADHRWLWPDVYRAITTIEPSLVMIENVRNLISYDKGRLFAGICADLVAANYDVRWLTLGACHVGLAHHRHRVFVLARRSAMPTIERIQTSFCGAKGGAILPTPTARDGDGRGTGDAGYWGRRARTGRTNGFPLDATVALLPTPTTQDWHGNKVNSVGRPKLPGAIQPQHWGRFAEAVEQHAALYGAPPAPTEPNRNGAPRLAPAFAEWLMAIPPGLVSRRLPRVDALRAIGNGVCPPQAARAFELLRAGYLTSYQPS